MEEVISLHICIHLADLTHQGAKASIARMADQSHEQTEVHLAFSGQITTL